MWEQRLRIHYNCVGAIEIPDLIPLSAPEVSVNTRKGVVVNYAPSTIAGMENKKRRVFLQRFQML